MSDPLLVLVVGGLGGLILAAAILHWRSVRRVLEKIELVHKATNSMHDELLRIARAEALARGIAQGILEERRRGGKPQRTWRP
ncbi:MAG TPA: hypothetical protein VJ816_08220 [Gemmatimonadales bacterium]|nr:hypothetical protein [Gemmatimonadales bacterium]